jgi:hypothetical protein
VFLNTLIYCLIDTKTKTYEQIASAAISPSHAQLPHSKPPIRRQLHHDTVEQDSGSIEHHRHAQIPGGCKVILQRRQAIDDDGATYPTEFLNTLQPQGMPPHKLDLKVGTPVMLMRNLNAKSGLANGTRLVILAMHNYLLEAQILTGKNKGDIVLIPRIPLDTSDSIMPVEFNKMQFPIRVAFAMTINKAQGQTMERVAIYLPRPVFGHGQLYMALSHVKQRNNSQSWSGMNGNCRIQRLDYTRPT